MSEKDPEKPTLEAGENIVDRCPVCKVKFSENVPTNMTHECPNPQCKAKFSIMVFG